jgi:hypothetical protein
MRYGHTTANICARAYKAQGAFVPRVFYVAFCIYEDGIEQKPWQRRKSFTALGLV